MVGPCKEYLAVSDTHNTTQKKSFLFFLSFIFSLSLSHNISLFVIVIVSLSLSLFLSGCATTRNPTKPRFLAFHNTYDTIQVNFFAFFFVYSVSCPFFFFCLFVFFCIYLLTGFFLLFWGLEVFFEL